MQWQIIRANNEYKYDSYIDAINYLIQADEIHREDASELAEVTSQRKETPMSLHRFMVELEISGFNTDNPERVQRYYKRYLDGIQTKK